MTAKPSASADYRMSAADFDKMMRGALSRPSPKEAPKVKPPRAKVPKAKVPRAVKNNER